MTKSAVLVCLVLSVSASAGQERGGGSEIERDFVRVGRMAATVIGSDIQQGSHLFDGFILPAFIKAIDEIQIFGFEKVCEPTTVDPNTGVVVPGRCLDARYFPEKGRIEFDTNIWNGKTCMQKISIVTHEYGRASGNEDGNYRYSSRMDLIKGLYQECDEYERELNNEKRACQAKVKFLGDALHEHDSDVISGFGSKANYISNVSNTLSSWKEGVGRGCENQGVDLCVNICWAKVKSDCFSACK